MLHLLLDPTDAEKKPWDLFFLSFLLAIVCIGLSYYFIGYYGGIGSAILLTAVLFPLMFKAFSLEEQRDLKLKDEGSRFFAHKKLIILFLCIFLGAIAGYFTTFLLLPEEQATTLFRDQLATITGGSIITGNAVSSDVALEHILKRNITLLGICLLLSLLFGLGSLFLLTWNGSVIGIAMAIFVQQSTTNVGTATIMSSLRYLVHGLPEMVSLFLASLGGGILAIAVLHHDLQKKKGKRIFTDGLTLIVASVCLLFLSALIEVFVTPFFF